jgi:hypothetical protein
MVENNATTSTTTASKKGRKARVNNWTFEECDVLVDAYAEVQPPDDSSESWDLVKENMLQSKHVKCSRTASALQAQFEKIGKGEMQSSICRKRPADEIRTLEQKANEALLTNTKRHHPEVDGSNMPDTAGGDTSKNHNQPLKKKALVKEKAGTPRKNIEDALLKGLEALNQSDGGGNNERIVQLEHKMSVVERNTEMILKLLTQNQDNTGSI